MDDPGTKTPDRNVLPLGNGAIVRPGEKTTIVGQPINGKTLNIEQILLTQSLVKVPPKHWIVNDILVGDRSQLEEKDLPGWLFTTRGFCGALGSMKLTFEGLDPVDHEHPLKLVVSYIGPNPEGEPFYGVAIGTASVPKPHLKFRSELISADDRATVIVKPCIQFDIEAFKIGRSPSDWVVCDLRINGKSQFTQTFGRASGGVAGAMFALDARDGSAFRLIDRCPVDGTIEIDVRYVGNNPHGSRLDALLMRRGGDQMIVDSPYCETRFTKKRSDLEIL